jgi:hypothetical protein
VRSWRCSKRVAAGDGDPDRQLALNLAQALKEESAKLTRQGKPRAALAKEEEALTLRRGAALRPA